MRLFDLIALIFDNLGRRKGRVLLTAIGVVIGTASVVLLVSLAIGLQKNATSQLYGIGDLRRIDVWPNYEAGPVMVEQVGGGGSGPGGMSQMKLLTPDTIEEIRAIPGVEYVIPRDFIMGQAMFRFGRLETYANVMGVEATDLSVFDYKLDRGTLQLERGTVIVGGWMAKNNWYDPKARAGQEMPEVPDMLDQQLTLVLQKWDSQGNMIEKKIKLKVVGVLAEVRGEPDSLFFMNLDDITAYNEWFQGKRINRNRDGYNNLVVRVGDTKDVMDVAEQINTMGYMANAAQGYVQGINSFFVVLQVVFGGVGAISLLVAAIGIANTMTMAILERTREIGLMKAIGATNRDVLTIFLGEAAGIGFVGGLGGVILGWGGSYVLDIVATSYMAAQSAQSGAPPPTVTAFTPLWLPVFSLIFATIIGLLSGLYPSLRAATLVPVNALKYE